MKTDVEADLWATELESLPLRLGDSGASSRIGGCGNHVRRLLGPVGGKNSRQIAEHVGHASS